MNRVDRAPGVQLVTDHPYARSAPPAPPVDFPFSGDDLQPEGLVAVLGRITAGLGVQGIVNTITGEAFITVALNGETETFEVPSDKLLEAFEHPFAYGCTLPL